MKLVQFICVNLWIQISAVLILFSPIWLFAYRQIYPNFNLSNSLTIYQSLVSNQWQTSNQHLTSDEISHLQDVSNLLVGLVIVWIGISFCLYKWREQSTLSRKQQVLVTISLYSLIILSISLNWQNSFTWFHQISFPQGNWAFPAESHLIQTFPNQFWKTSALVHQLISLTGVSLYIWWSQKDSNL